MQIKVESNPERLPPWQVNLIAHLFNAIKNNYIFSEKIDETEFKKMLSEDFVKINASFSSADKEKFCTEVNKILQKIDPHLILQYDPEQIAEHNEHGRIIPDARKNGCAKFVLDGLEPPESWLIKFEKENYGFEQRTNEQSPLIPETIGYVKINDFLDLGDRLGQLAKKQAYEIITNMQGKQAIIIDLRDSHGGSSEMVEYIMSYLLTESDKLKIKDGIYNTIYDRSTDITTSYKVKQSEFNLSVPIYVLTNESTFSAAEEFAYDLQQINKHALKDDRFTIIGQKTKGGAHAMTGFPLMEPESGRINENYFLWVPTKTTINPYTYTNWEDGPKKNGETPGVEPDIEISKEEDALEMAINHVSLLTPQQTKSVEPEITQQYRNIVKKEKLSGENSDFSNEVENKSAITPLQITPKPPWQQ